MPRKINPELIQEDIHKKDLEDMVEDIDDLLDSNPLIDNLGINEQKGSYMDFEKIKSEADLRSNEIVDSITGFYLDDRIYDGVQGERFLKNKKDMDKMTISNLIFQMKTAEHAITKLLEEIDAGNMHPRQFEVLASLQKSKMEIVKHLAFVTIQMENNYKIIRQEYDNLYKDDSVPEQISAGLGTKALLQRMHQKMNDTELEMPLDSEKM